MPFPLLQAAQFARLAYESPKAVTRAFRTGEGTPNTVECMRHVRSDAEPLFITDPGTDVQAYALLLTGDVTTLLVTVRGTSSLIDAFHDISGVTMPLPSATTLAPGVRVHSGFFCQYAALAPMLQPTVTELLSKGDAFDVVFTGHSAGAAIGALAAFHAALDNVQNVQYIGFGSPRVGNGAFVDLFKTKIPAPVLVKHGRDPCVKVIDGFGYKHICDMQAYGPFDVCPQLPLLFFMQEHDIIAYVQAIEKGDVARSPTWADRVVQTVVAWLTDRIK